VRRAAPTWLAFLLPAVATAHRGSITYDDIRLSERDVTWEIQIGAAELAEPLGLPQYTVPDRDRALRGRAEILDYVVRRIAVLNNGGECAARPEGLSPRDKDGGFAVAVRVRFDCARRLEQVDLRYRLFFDLDSRHQSFARIEVEGTLRQHVFTAQDTRYRVEREVTAWDNVRDYLVLGIGHIFTGYDHICFLIALLLVAGIDRRGEPRGLKRGLRYTIGIVTAFTAAHSITLISAALGIVRLPGRLVESAIALSIAYVAAENVLVREPRHRWMLAFGFGLVHGLGFAGVLADIGLPRRGLLASLVSFNVGVELGQATIVSAVFPVLNLLAHRGSRRWYRPAVLLAGSTVVLLFALLWFVERAFAHPLLGGRLG
jgi:HupE/UreJ protein